MSVTRSSAAAEPREQVRADAETRPAAARRGWRTGTQVQRAGRAATAATDSDESGPLSTTTTVTSSLKGASIFGHEDEMSSAVTRTQRTTAKNSMSRDFKIDDLHNEIKDLERRLKESERENKALKRVQARQERELLKAESARHSEGPDASRAHAEEVRALRALLAEGRDRLRDYEKKLHVRNCELQKLRQALADMQRKLDEKQALLEKEAESEAKLQQLERDLHERDTDVQELRRKLDTVQISYKKEMLKEKAQNKSFQKQLQALKADNELLQRKIRDSSMQSFFLSRKGFFNQDGVASDPKSIFDGMDQEKKEQLLARLRDIDHSGTLVKSSAKRPKAARRLSMDSHQSRLRLRSTATNGFLLNESLSDEHSTTELTPPYGPNAVKARRMSDTSIIGPSRRGNSLCSILEMQALQYRNTDEHEKKMLNEKVHGAENKEGIEVGLIEKLAPKAKQFEGMKSGATKVVPNNFLPWEPWGSAC